MILPFCIKIIILQTLSVCLFFKELVLLFLNIIQIDKNLKGLIYVNMEPTAQGRDSTFTFHHAQLKKAILLLKRPKVLRFFLLTVHIYCQIYYLPPCMYSSIS